MSRGGPAAPSGALLAALRLNLQQVLLVLLGTLHQYKPRVLHVLLGSIKRHLLLPYDPLLGTLEALWGRH